VKRPLVFSEKYGFHWPGHVFPTGKYVRLAERLREAGLANGFHTPVPATDEELLACHTEGYLGRLSRMASGEEPWDASFECPVTCDVLDVFRLAAGGTTMAARLAVEHRLAANLSGGFHHAYPSRGEGFCLLNDVPVAAHALKREGLAGNVLVVDLDVHQGNGTAVMCAGDPWLFTLSVHQQNNYPVKERSDLDVGLPDGMGDEDYIAAVEDALERVSTRFKPDVVFYLAGADPYEQDRLGGLAVTLDGLAERDRVVFDWAAARDAAVVGLLAGGYAIDEADVVQIHFAMVEELLKRVE
jgi:acetoin utilization deacetylase AcuC-like enzyme